MCSLNCATATVGRVNDRAADATDLRARAASVPLREVDPSGPEAAVAMGHYFAELDRRFPRGFDPGTPTPPDSFTVAANEGRPVAGGGVQQIGEGIGEVKRMWVDLGWRGAGLGARLLRHLEDVALAAGHRVIRLDTNGVLAEAIAMYERAGYTAIERYNDNPYAELFFEKPLPRS